jgi:hypothetical protein
MVTTGWFLHVVHGDTSLMAIWERCHIAAGKAGLWNERSIVLGVKLNEALCSGLATADLLCS